VRVVRAPQWIGSAGHLGVVHEIWKVHTEPVPVDELAVGHLLFVDQPPQQVTRGRRTTGAPRIGFDAQYVCNELRRRERPALV
jgi:hypothetical protein